MHNVLLAATGSVASIKIPFIINELQKNKMNVKLIITEAAKNFVCLDDVNCDVYTDADEWKQWVKRGDPILHIELRKWTDILLIAPLSANSMAKIANGLSDGLLFSCIRAWDAAKPIIVAPAMNTLMYTNPITSIHTETIQRLFPWIEILPPQSKKLVCGDVGIGAMAEWSDCVAAVLEKI